ncbi:hypothetical protein DLM86_04150 [Paenibacillus flagellatus]|uniref:Uncharacterized protein n=1 Tax=Paenibacillus flagellatus TaxID=2211139 RepID=A0A2V5K9V9_9BACL|nr:hypothetical protein DLM86_04150 [Paenibacillus flagellatus]
MNLFAGETVDDYGSIEKTGQLARQLDKLTTRCFFHRTETSYIPLPFIRTDTSYNWKFPYPTD